MVATMPKIDPTARFTTTATAALLGIERTTLWYASKRGDITYHTRKDNGRRFYRGIDIIRYFNSEK